MLSGVFPEFLLYEKRPDVAMLAVPAAPIERIVKLIYNSQFLLVVANKVIGDVSARVIPSVLQCISSVALFTEDILPEK